MERFRISSLSFFWCLSQAETTVTLGLEELLEGDFWGLNPCFAICWLGEPGKYIYNPYIPVPHLDNGEQEYISSRVVGQIQWVKTLGSGESPKRVLYYLHAGLLPLLKSLNEEAIRLRWIKCKRIDTEARVDRKCYLSASPYEIGQCCPPTMNNHNHYHTWGI